MAGTQENNMSESQRDYILSDFHCLDQMHDEQIDEIRMDKDILVLKFSHLHFPHEKQYNSAELIFSDFEEITSDVYIEIFERINCIITSGKRFYIDEFIPYMNQNSIILEVMDILHGYEEILIRGKIINNNNSYGEHFNLSISVKKISYKFF